MVAMGTSTGSTIVLNVNLDTLPLETVAAVVHEATHAYANLVDSGGPSLFAQPWPEGVRVAAQATVAQFNLEAGLESVWGQLHEDAVESNIATEYLGSDWEEQGTGLAGDRVAAASGFAAAYGARNAGEDLAVYGHDTSTLRARTSARGMVVVSEYDDTKLAGAVFFLSLRNAGGEVIDNYPFGTFRVDTNQR